MSYINAVLALYILDYIALSRLNADNLPDDKRNVHTIWFRVADKNPPSNAVIIQLTVNVQYYMCHLPTAHVVTSLY